MGGWVSKSFRSTKIKTYIRLGFVKSDESHHVGPDSVVVERGLYVVIRLYPLSLQKVSLTMSFIKKQSTRYVRNTVDEWR